MRRNKKEKLTAVLVDAWHSSMHAHKGGGLGRKGKHSWSPGCVPAALSPASKAPKQGTQTSLSLSPPSPLPPQHTHTSHSTTTTTAQNHPASFPQTDPSRATAARPARATQPRSAACPWAAAWQCPAAAPRGGTRCKRGESGRLAAVGRRHQGCLLKSQHNRPDPTTSWPPPTKRTRHRHSTARCTECHWWPWVLQVQGTGGQHQQVGLGGCEGGLSWVHLLDTASGVYSG